MAASRTTGYETTGPAEQERVEQVLITDVLLRDGLQIEPVTVPTSDKIRLASGLLEAGLTSLEVGAFVHPEKVPQMADTDPLVAALQPGTDAALHTLVFNERGARRAVAAGARHVRFVVSASDGHSRANAGTDTRGALERLEPCARLLTEHGVRIEASIATAFVCPYDGETPPRRVVDVARRLVELGAKVIHLADTIGAASPAHIRRTVCEVRAALPAQPLGLHLHNTYGMASANAWEGVQLGIRRFDAALGGIGGCPFAPGAAGNIATDDLVNLFHHVGIATGVDAAKLVAVRDQLHVLLGRKLESALSSVPAAPVALRV
ncbi:hydroxymethylglutaryl-CoA lyase [Streptomyces spinosisporus]|uniref:Hydroxymethylglutaryl-CoA lyase n=1 Tax=Streptomyces spinosisporus TaxID=2927582 RepID=A0ABS9XIW3_9ACTN|nr:hydroxymethylglutaryl-CoA lyase [Streptomyces spinosisporus]MCI3242006.1 hydroxymethylglutaryl-CoA lyase [Streptomyces spinosisporus]